MNCYGLRRKCPQDVGIEKLQLLGSFLLGEWQNKAWLFRCRRNSPTSVTTPLQVPSSSEDMEVTFKNQDPERVRPVSYHQRKKPTVKHVNSKRLLYAVSICLYIFIQRG